MHVLLQHVIKRLEINPKLNSGRFREEYRDSNHDVNYVPNQFSKKMRYMLYSNINVL